jgi:hypothetical protein
LDEINHGHPIAFQSQLLRLWTLSNTIIEQQTRVQIICRPYLLNTIPVDQLQALRELDASTARFRRRMEESKAQAEVS